MKKIFFSLIVLTLIFSASPALAANEVNMFDFFRDALNNQRLSNLNSNLNDPLSGFNPNSLGGNNQDFKGILELITSSILNPLVALFLGIALIYFMWGVLTYVRRGESEGDRAKGIQMMTYGIIAIFVMVSVWGLVYILINTFNLNTSAPPIPKLQ